MSLGVYCECGKCVPVTEGDAGRAVTCSCALRVVVPLLEEFRDHPVQLSAATLERRLFRLLAAGELPKRGVCLHCGEENTTQVVSVHLECEKAETRTSEERIPGSTIVIPGVMTMWKVKEHVEVIGRDTVLPVPICLCTGCRDKLFGSSSRASCLISLLLLAAGGLLGYFSILLGVAGLVIALVLSFWLLSRSWSRRQGAIKDVLRKVPIYSQILQRYGNATVGVSEDGPDEREEPHATMNSGPEG